MFVTKCTKAIKKDISSKENAGGGADAFCCFQESGCFEKAYDKYKTRNKPVNEQY